MKAFIGTLGIMLLCATCSAQSLRVATATFLIASHADALTTYQGQLNGTLVEKDPLYAHMSPTASLAVGEAVDIAQAVFWTKVVAPKHPKLAKVALFASAALRAYATIRTVNNLKGR